MTTCTSTIKNLVYQFLANKKKNQARKGQQRTSFTPRLENLENRTLLTTVMGLTLEPVTDDVVLVANSQQNDAAFIKFDGMVAGPERTMHHHATVDYLFAVEGSRERSSADDNPLS